MNVILPSFPSTNHGAFSPRIFNLSGKRGGLVGRCVVLAALACGTWHHAAAQTKPATTTTIAVTSGGGAVTSVASGSVVTLTATVNAGAAAVTPGQIDFCDASAAYCTDIHLLARVYRPKPIEADFPRAKILS